MLPLSSFIQNNFFNRQFLSEELQKTFDNKISAPIFEAIKLLYDKTKFQQINEAQIEEEFIKPTLQVLGYAYAYQVSKKAFGKIHKPDFVLFENTLLKDAHYAQAKDENKDILALCESKAYHVELDNKKIEENPHFQLIRYLNDLKIDFGFLTNGHFWRFYDTKVNRADKIFYEIDLEKIIENNDLEAFNYFYFVFRKDNFVKTNNEITNNEIKDSTIQEILNKNNEIKSNVEKDLKDVIYGSESIVEQIGQALYTNSGKDYTLADIYQNSVTFTFRLLFIAYFEDKFEATLFKENYFYKKFSLHQLVRHLEDTNEFPPEKYNGWGKLKDLFKILDEGREDDDIPLLNGGLFAQEKAPLLSKNRILTNYELSSLLKNLLEIKVDQKNKTSFLQRDFKTLSITHLGNIYEGLLEFDFKEVISEAQYYITYQEKGKEVDAQLDNYDYNHIKNDTTKKITQTKTYSKGEIYFSNSSNSRKSTASYYTPTSFTEFMAKNALKEALANEPQILNLRILDNACGSGHFLLEILNQITEISYQNIENQENISIQNLKETLETEKIAISKNIKKYLGEDAQIDELVLLKRLLLKKIIFGVDLNPFAVELTRLSLWLDTFILGTPLSFIEHHIKQGNALIGADFDEILKNLKGDVIGETVKTKLEDTIHQLKDLSDLKDTTQEEVLQSKQIYKDLQKPLKTLNRVLNLYTYQQFVPFEYPNKEQKQQKDSVLINIKTAFDQLQNDILEEKNTEMIAEIDKIAKKYLFFNYEIEFAEVFQENENSQKGFHIIIGNPPWDKTKFDDKDFFPQYRSSYRTMKQSEKEAVRQNVLEYPQVKQQYENQQDSIEKTNEYYKITYPYNAGAGDNNLFRFFIEKNLSLLSPQGSLTYLTPSAWIYEDGSKKLRKHILQKYQLRFFFQFENREKIFERVDSRYKFAAFQIKKPNPALTLLAEKAIEDTKDFIPVRFMQTDARILKTDEHILEYAVADIALLSPEHLSLMEVKTNQDLEILRKIYAKFPPISTDFIDFRNELHATNDKDLFIENKATGLLPLYEGKMIHQYNSNYAEPQYWVNELALQKRLESVEISRLVDDIFGQIEIDFKANHKNLGKQKTVLAYLGLVHESDLVPFLVFDTSFTRLMFRGISRNTDERTMISGLMPANCTYQHSMFGHSPKNYILENKKVVTKEIPLERILFVNAIFNSLIADYVWRFVVDINMSKTYLMRLPLPQPTDLELKENEVYRKIIKNSFLLNWHHSKKSNNPTGFDKNAKELDISEENLPKTEKSYNLLRLENDKLIAELYGISKQEMEHITSEAYFKVLQNKNPAYLRTLLETW
jgi:hypothetical protein